MVEPLGLCADLEFALTCVRQDLCTWSTCTHTCTHKHEAVMCLIYRPEHLGNRFENAAKRMCSLGSCTVTLPAVHNRKRELPCGYLLFSIFVPPFVSYSSWSLWIHYLFFVRGNPPCTFSCIPSSIHFLSCDCNGHLVKPPPHTRTPPPSICFCFSFLLVRCLTDASRCIFLRSYFTLGLFGSSSTAWCVKLSACN